MSEVRAKIVNIQTGEVEKEIFEGDRVKVVKAKVEKKEKSEPKVFMNKEEPFIKIFTKPLFELSRSLTGTESQFLNYLIQFIRYDSGILAYSNGRHVTRAAMAKDTGLSKNTIDRLINSLYDKEILGRHKTGRIVTLTVNPFIFMRGQAVNKTLYECFKDSKWAKFYEKQSGKKDA